ncbi:terpene synthase family protein [Vitiosangium sp. GDMCC 1.1324]|uniref:terpene synthase family protein n=1 Tax=Vitiosangium sp. (strain GDMCC 1.1324) TaxID=2138576 RepID=UPI000D37F052|nr:terpene synthase family protein [Vitiosangium sp. GDMCC 1.1324]PTL77671.1 hypothetical protein DAT35_43580 [Vitiosangium sp. GDMCC 1.1324]
MSTRNPEGKHFGVVRELRNQYAEVQRQSVPPEQMARVQARVAEILPALRAWRERFPVMAASRLKSTAMACILPFPEASAALLLLLSQVGLLVFAVDDIADGEIGTYADADIFQALERFVETAARPESHAWTGSDPASSLGAAIQDVTRELQKASGARFLPLWREHFRRMCEAHAKELRDKRHYPVHGGAPPLDEYLSVTQYSSGGTMYFSAVLVVFGPDFPGEPLQEPLIERALSENALAGRWINDVRGLERERAEGKFNSLILLMAGGMPEAEAERVAVERCGQHLETLQGVVKQLPGPLQAWGQALVTMGYFALGFYLQREFHHAEPDAPERSG